jgi:YfiH family protein
MTMRAAIVAAGHDWIVPDWATPRRVQAFVTTRNGGVSIDAASSLDLGPARLDTLDASVRARIVENRRRVARLLPSAPIWLEQTHGTHVAVVDAPALAAMRERSPIADAAVTRMSDVPLAVRVADCLPVFLADACGEVVAVAHAGWRGLAAGILEATVEAMRVDPRSLAAWIGPGIGPEAFEVGADVLEAFRARDAHAARHFQPHGERKWLADLPALAHRRLAALGVQRIDACGLCTFSDAARFFSYRRNRTSGRLGAFVWLAPR